MLDEKTIIIHGKTVILNFLSTIYLIYLINTSIYLQDFDVAREALIDKFVFFIRFLSMSKIQSQRSKIIP